LNETQPRLWLMFCFARHRGLCTTRSHFSQAPTILGMAARQAPTLRGRPNPGVFTSVPSKSRCVYVRAEQIPVCSRPCRASPGVFTSASLWKVLECLPQNGLGCGGHCPCAGGRPEAAIVLASGIVPSSGSGDYVPLLAFQSVYHA